MQLIIGVIKLIECFPCLSNECFEIEFVSIGSLVIRTKVPEHILSNYDDFKSAVRSFLVKIVEACQLDTDTITAGIILKKEETKLFLKYRCN
jgi:hypothetical protein